MMILRSLLGIAVLTAVLWLFSSNKRKVNWAMVGKGLLLQFVLALAVLNVPGVSWAFEKFSLVAVTLLDFTREGSTFLFGSLITETDNFGYPLHKTSSAPARSLGEGRRPSSGDEASSPIAPLGGVGRIAAK